MRLPNGAQCLLSHLSKYNSIPHSRAILNGHGYRDIHHACKVLVIGGGTGGCSMAAKFAKKYKDPNKLIIIEPSEVHYYQPLFTLIGGGIASFEASKRPMGKVLPKYAKWIQDSAVSFDPAKNTVTTRNGDTVEYDVMIVATGLQYYWENIPGLLEAVRYPYSNVCSIYGPETVSNVFRTMQNTTSGNAIFTFPNTPVKCPGAPQKIAYIAEDYFCKHNLRKKVSVTYNTSLPVIFGVKKYADALWQLCENRGIIVNTQTNLIEVDHVKKIATFEKLDESKEKITQKFSMLHVCPPMGSPKVLKDNPDLTNEAGFITVDPGTLQHIKYPNIFGIGDCTNTPNSKTMAAIASQGKVVYRNIVDYMDGKTMHMKYGGYSSCPLVTGYNKCILAEFDYNLQPLETFPIDQAKEHYTMFLLKKYGFPFIYWNRMLKGSWDGPEFMRKCFQIIG